MPNLVNKKYGEIIIKVPEKTLERWCEWVKAFSLAHRCYEIKVYSTHFKGYLAREEK